MMAETVVDDQTITIDELTPSSRPGFWRGAARATVARRSHLWPLLFLIAAVLIVWALPVLGDFAHLRLSNPGDSESFTFSLAWNIHAITSFQNPFFTPNLYAPNGLDLGNAITVPSVSLLVAPVTMLFGATAGFNVAFLLSIFFASWSVYLLARALFGSVIGASIAALLMVVNPYFAGHALGHLNLMWIFGLPLLAYLFVKSVTGRLPLGWLIAITALIIAFTAGASTELVVTQAVFGVIAIAVALCFAAPDLRARIMRSTAWLAIGAVVGGLLSLPIVIAAVVSGVPAAPGNPPALYASDLTNTIAPTNLVRWGEGPFQTLPPMWLGNGAENTAFLGIPMLIFLAVLAYRVRGRLALGLVTFATIAFIASLGPLLTIAGKQTIPLPWAITAFIPGLDHALPGRFSTFVFETILMLIAYAWSQARLPRIVTAIAVGLTLVLMVPSTAAMAFPTPAKDPAFVTSGRLARTLHSGDNVLVLPAGQWGPGMRWQTELGFDFDMPTGNGGGAIRPKALDDPVGNALWQTDLDFDYPSKLPPWLERNKVDLIIVPTDSPQWNDVVEKALGRSVKQTGGVWVYHPDPGGGWSPAR
jgi:hypothetical protein